MGEDALAGVEAGRLGGFAVVVVGVDRGAGAGRLRERGASLVVPDLGELQLIKVSGGALLGVR